MNSGERQPFEGFPEDLPDFLWGLALNNEKPWFEAHRGEFERCLRNPITALAWQVQGKMEERFPGAVPEVHISRIYRDARRLYGRGPYNDHLWFSLGQTRELYDPRPKFWFGIRADCCIYGMGMWCTGGERMECWRKSIDDAPDKLSKIVRKLNEIEGLQLCGEQYKRPKGDPGALLYSWYNAREIALEKTLRFSPDPPGPELAEELADAFSQLEPLYKYLLQI